MNKIALATIICFVVAACENKESSKDVGSVWPDVKLDTLRQYDSLDLKNLGYDINAVADSLIVEYPNGTRAMHQTITIDSVLYYIIEGDILMDEQEYLQYRIKVMLLEDAKLAYIPPSADLRIELDLRTSAPVRWPENDTITFCINWDSFRDKNNYELVKINIRQAANDWMNTCNVVFQYKPQFDLSKLLWGNKEVDFVVLEHNIDLNTRLVAKAFYPNDIIRRRNLLVTPRYYTTGYNKVGVFRHELGHILGFYHEQLSPDAPPVCRGDVVDGAVPVPDTRYDSISVMHYVCGGAGTSQLNISPNDRRGATQIYGPPKAKPIAANRRRSSGNPIN